jgi:hypothetical protein
VWVDAIGLLMSASTILQQTVITVIMMTLIRLAIVRRGDAARCRRARAQLSDVADVSDLSALDARSGGRNRPPENRERAENNFPGFSPPRSVSFALRSVANRHQRAKKTQ